MVTGKCPVLLENLVNICNFHVFIFCKVVQQPISGARIIIIIRIRIIETYAHLQKPGFCCR